MSHAVSCCRRRCAAPLLHCMQTCTYHACTSRACMAGQQAHTSSIDDTAACQMANTFQWPFGKLPNGAPAPPCPLSRAALRLGRGGLCAACLTHPSAH